MIYKPTLKELEIFCGYTPEEFSVPYEILEHASRLAKVDAGFVGMGPEKYVLEENNLEIQIYYNEHVSIEFIEDEMILDSIHDFEDVQKDHVYGLSAYKAFMFRLVLLWMKQQGENNVHTND